MAGKSEGLIHRNLRLIVEKGPLEGQTLEFSPGTKIQIGRIIRGNTVAIKDAGISTKHLAINFQANNSGENFWSLSDLGSSNGTVLNSINLEPFSPVRVSDGDIVKIGECTSIKIEIAAEVEVEEESKVRRNPSRRRRGGGKLGKDDLNEGVDEKMENVGRKEKSSRKTTTLEEQNVVENADQVGNNLGEDEEVVAKLRPRRGRAAKKEEILGICTADFNQNVVQGIEQKQVEVENLKRITRNMTRKGGNLESKKTENGGNMGIQRITRSVGKQGNVEILEEVGKKVTKKCVGRGRRKLKVETLIDESVEDKMVKKEVEVMEKTDLSLKDDFPVKKEVLDEEEEERVVEVMMVWKEGRESGMEDDSAGALASVSGVKNGCSSELDLEKMTLGDWLDYLEVNLPKQIVDDTEEMISVMRQKAEKLHEFMMQQKSAKVQV